MDFIDIIRLIGSVGGFLGMGGLAGVVLNHRKIKSETKRLEERQKAELIQAEALNHAKIEQAKAETALLVEKARVELINDLQQERDTLEVKLTKAQERIHELEEQIGNWKARCSMLEMILTDQGIALPY